MVVPVDGAQLKEATIATTKTNAKCEASDESEYSSLEDDDDIQGEFCEWLLLFKQKSYNITN